MRENKKQNENRVSVEGVLYERMTGHKPTTKNYDQLWRTIPASGVINECRKRFRATATDSADAKDLVATVGASFLADGRRRSRQAEPRENLSIWKRCSQRRWKIAISIG